VLHAIEVTPGRRLPFPEEIPGNQIDAGSVQMRRTEDRHMDQEWMNHGNCRHEPPARFFPSDGVGVERARRICATCPVKGQCLDYALRNRIDHGVWGGASERERRRILKTRRQEASALTA
jgi:WhiB family redox-sensing transcriptional regulator